MKYLATGSEATIYQDSDKYGIPVIIKEYNQVNEDKHYSTTRAVQDLVASAELGYSPKVIHHYIKNETQYVVMADLSEDYTSLWTFYLRNDRKVVSSVLRKCRAIVKSLHKLDIVHGDLHSDNILVSSDGSDIKLIDFSGAITMPFSLDKPETLKSLDSMKNNIPF